MTAPTHPDPTQLRAEAATAKISGAGVWLLLTGALFFGSSFKAMRFSLGPMYVHPALFLIVPALFVVLPRVDSLRTKIVPAAALFLVLQPRVCDRHPAVGVIYASDGSKGYPRRGSTSDAWSA